jgi:hypothetical protein
VRRRRRVPMRNLVDEEGFYPNGSILVLISEEVSLN